MSSRPRPHPLAALLAIPALLLIALALPALPALGQEEAAETELVAAHTPDECAAVVWIDAPTAGATVRGPTEVAGWALDALETFLAGVDVIDIFDGPPDAGGRLLATTAIGIPRPDVDRYWGRADIRAGWSETVNFSGLPAGARTLHVRGRSHCGYVTATVAVTVDPTPPPPPPAAVSLSVNDVRRTEGDSGTRDFEFTVSLSGASGATVTVDYETSDGSAREGSDYARTGGSLTFSPGETSKTVRVSVYGDNIDEGDEIFYLNLRNAANASIARARGTGTIDDDDRFGLGVSSGICGAGYYYDSTLGRCIFTGTGVGTGLCGAGYIYDSATGRCISTGTGVGTGICPSGYIFVNGQCIRSGEDIGTCGADVIVLDQAGQTIPVSFNIRLSGYALSLGGTLSTGGTSFNAQPATTVTIRDIAIGFSQTIPVTGTRLARTDAESLYGSSARNSGFTANWNTSGLSLSGARRIQVTATNAACGSFSRDFIVFIGT